MHFYFATNYLQRLQSKVEETKSCSYCNYQLHYSCTLVAKICSVKMATNIAVGITYRAHPRETKRQSGITSLLVVRFYFKMRVRNLGKKPLTLFIVENPAVSEIWRQSPLALLEDGGVSSKHTIDQCMFGAVNGDLPARKSTALLSNMPLDSFTRVCNGCHEHNPLVGISI